LCTIKVPLNFDQPTKHPVHCGKPLT